MRAGGSFTGPSCRLKRCRQEDLSNSAADAIALFQDGDDWRLEFLRRLAALSVSDKLAAQALAAIRVSAKDQ